MRRFDRTEGSDLWRGFSLTGHACNSDKGGPVNDLQHHCRRHAARDKEDANDEEHGGNQLTAVFVQETDDGIEDAVEISGCHGTNGEWSPTCLLYTSPSPRDRTRSRMPSSA